MPFSSTGAISLTLILSFHSHHQSVSWPTNPNWDTKLGSHTIKVIQSRHSRKRQEREPPHFTPTALSPVSRLPTAILLSPVCLRCHSDFLCCDFSFSLWPPPRLRKDHQQVNPELQIEFRLKESYFPFVAMFGLPQTTTTEKTEEIWHKSVQLWCWVYSCSVFMLLVARRWREAESNNSWWAKPWIWKTNSAPFKV